MRSPGSSAAGRGEQVEGDALGLHADRVDRGEELFVRWVAPAGRDAAGDSISVAALAVPCSEGESTTLLSESVGGIANWAGGTRRDLQGRSVLGQQGREVGSGAGAMAKGVRLVSGEVQLPGREKPGWYECRYHVKGVGAGAGVGAVAARSHPFLVRDD
jgi:hypothetical protein